MPRMIMIFQSRISLGYLIYRPLDQLSPQTRAHICGLQNLYIWRAQCPITPPLLNFSCVYAVLEQRLVLYIPPYFSITSPSMIQVNISFSMVIWKPLHLHFFSLWWQVNKSWTIGRYQPLSTQTCVFFRLNPNLRSNPTLAQHLYRWWYTTCNPSTPNHGPYCRQNALLIARCLAGPYHLIQAIDVMAKKEIWGESFGIIDWFLNFSINSDIINNWVKVSLFESLM